jgi:hypothetical protein
MGKQSMRHRLERERKCQLKQLLPVICEA